MGADRIFLDANVLFSAAWGSPGLGRLWELAREGRVQLLASEQVAEEARRNLDTPEQHERLAACLREVEVIPLPDPALPCPLELPLGDRLVLLTAAAAQATHLLTGDRRYFGPYFGRRVWGMSILLPGEYSRRKK